MREKRVPDLHFQQAEVLVKVARRWGPYGSIAHDSYPGLSLGHGLGTRRSTQLSLTTLSLLGVGVRDVFGDIVL